MTFGQAAVLTSQADAVSSAGLSPVLLPIADQTATVGKRVALAATSEEPVPGLAIAYALRPGASAGARIDPSSGAFTWTPTAPGTYAFTIQATDNGSSPLSDAQSFTITVTAPPATVPLPSGFGAGRDAFVTVLYHDDLNRLPEPSGLRFWSRTLSKGVKPIIVAGAIWHSREHRVLQSLHIAPTISFSRSYSDAVNAGFQAAHPSRSHTADSLSRARGAMATSAGASNLYSVGTTTKVRKHGRVMSKFVPVAFGSRLAGANLVSQTLVKPAKQHLRLIVRGGVAAANGLTLGQDVTFNLQK